MRDQILALVTLVSTAVMPTFATASVGKPVSVLVRQKTKVLAEHRLDLTNRLPVESGNQVFADNILLSLHYLKGDTNILVYQQKKGVDWEKVREPFEISFILAPGEIFAFHGNTLPEFAAPVFDPEGLRPEWAGGPAVTMNSRFFMEEGYKSLAGLGGNGVCHLASLMNWVAQEAGLEVAAKVNHDFSPVPGVPREFGTSIQSQDKNQNLYIKNGFEFPVVFEFKTEKQAVLLSVVKL